MAVEMTMLFPGFMTLVSETGAIGLLYAEIFAFMLETFALVLYVYYADAFKSKYAHWFCGVLIAVGTIMSAVFITMLNAWMNTPNGFDHQCVHSNWRRHRSKSVGAIPYHIWTR